MSNSTETPTTDATTSLSALEQELRTWPTIDHEVSIRLYAVYGIEHTEHVFQGRALEVLRLPAEEQEPLRRELVLAFMFNVNQLSQRQVEAGKRINLACSCFIKEAADAAPRAAVKGVDDFEFRRLADERHKQDELIWPEAFRILELPTDERRAELLRMQSSNQDLYDQILRALQIHFRWKHRQHIVETVTANHNQ